MIAFVIILKYSSICKYNNCKNERVRGQYYCSHHVCAYPAEHNDEKIKCKFWKEDESGYCSLHQCKHVIGENEYGISEYCVNPVVKADAPCCEEHTCNKEECYNGVYKDSNYCKTHICKEADLEGNLICYNVSIKDGDYCEKHTCKKEGCYNRRLNLLDYCSEHQRLQEDEKFQSLF